MKILVTGASGYLGGRLCHALLKQGHSIRALVRRSSDVSGLPSDGDLELAYGDVTDYSSLLDAFSGCHVIFHAAALVEVWLPDPSRFFALIERFNGRLPGYIGSGNDKFPFCHVDDVADGHIAAMDRGRPGVRYLLTGENASFMQIFDMAAVITGTRRPQFCIPLWLIEACGWIAVFFSRITGKLPLISYPTARVLGHQWAYSCEKAKTELGYNPRSLKDGLLEMLPWLRSLGAIKY